MVFADHTQLSSSNIEVENAYGQGLKLAAEGQHDLAIQSFEKATGLDPNHHQSFDAAGDVFASQGQVLAAADCYACAININNGIRKYKEKFIANIRGQRFGQHNEELRAVVLKCLKAPDLLHQDLAPLWLSDLELDQGFKSLLQKLDGDPSYKIFKKAFKRSPPSFLSDPFFLHGMAKLVVYRKPFENFVRFLRRFCLEQHERSIPLLKAIAQYAYHTEYVFSASEDELKKLEALDPKASEENCLLHGCYGWLYKRDDTAELLQLDVLNSQIEEPLTLQHVAEKVDVLFDVKDTTSRAVQEQYEEFPYPRWSAFEPTLKHEQIEASLKDKAIKILIAGCGTGREGIELAAALPKAEVVAVDLSRVSLAYAQEKAQHFGVENIEFKHADILDLGGLDQEFDYITSSGVLHHMRDPMAGWRVINGLLKPGGLMRIALYSEKAREGIVKSREVIAQNDIASDADGIRYFRDNATALVGAQTEAYLQKYIDYYYMSECRDLLFHVQEHRYTLPQVKAALDELGLEFLGFHLPAEVFDQYQKMFKDEPGAVNLDNWDAFESKHPETFKIMYRFWCRKT